MSSEKPSLLGILNRPSLQFQRLNEQPHFGLALVINTLLTAIITTLMIYVSGQDQTNFILENQGLPSNTSSVMEISTITILIFFVSLFSVPLSNLIGAFFCWVFVMIFGGQTTFQKMFAVNVYSGFVLVLGTFVSAIIYVTTPTLTPFSFLVINLLNLLFRFIFMVWHYIVLAIGLKETTTLTTGKAYGIVIIFFLISFIAIIFSAIVLFVFYPH